MSLTYDSYVSQLTNLMSVASSTDPNFTTFLPGGIDYAEGRLYRDLDLLSVRVTNTSVSCSSGVRTVALSTATGTFLVLERLNMLTSAGAPSSVATRNPIMIVTPAYVDAVYPSAASSNTGLPTVAARISDTTLILGPTPDQPYGTEQYGTQRPTPLSSGNSSTWLTQNVPELFMAATMVFAAGYMRDFGAQSDNPQMSQSWENQYQTLLKSAMTDEMRKKYQSVAWSNQMPSPTATPPRV
jgi:hypothetical protein